jgi:hypothetical protein
MSRLIIIVLILLACVRPGSCAESVFITPVMVSVFDPVELPFADSDVAGIRVDILYGKCRNLYGLDLGFVNYTTGNEIAFSSGVVNVAGNDYTGFSTGVANVVGKDFTGLQIGVANYATRAQGFQIGLYNGADDICGMQIGVINVTRLMRGCQLGLINVIENSDVSFLPVFNCFF